MSKEAAVLGAAVIAWAEAEAHFEIAEDDGCCHASMDEHNEHVDDVVELRDRALTLARVAALL
jgi:hypothetical protein